MSSTGVKRMAMILNPHNSPFQIHFAQQIDRKIDKRIAPIASHSLHHQ